MSKKEHVNYKDFFELDDALMPMFPADGIFKKNKTFYSLQQICEEVFPSEFIRKYWEQIGYKPSVMDIALIIFSSDRPLYRKLLLMRSLIRFAEDEKTKECIQNYLDSEVECLRKFQQESPGTIFEMQVSYDDGGTWYSLALMHHLNGLVGLGNLWKNAPCQENCQNNLEIRIVKRIIYDDDAFMPKAEDGDKKKDKSKRKKIKRSSQKNMFKLDPDDYPYMPEDAGGIELTKDFYIKECSCTYRGSIDFAAFVVGSFSVPSKDDVIPTKYVYLPFPYHYGDLVHDVSDDTYGVIMTAPKPKELFEEFEKNKKRGLGDYDFFSNYINVMELQKDGSLSSKDKHVFDLEPVAEDNSHRYRALAMVSKQILGKKIDVIELSREFKYYALDNKQ